MAILTPDYIVGFVDGEGCFHLHTAHKKEGRPVTRPVFEVCNTHREVIYSVQETLGIGYVYPRQPKYPNSQLCYHLRASGLQDLLKLVAFFDKHLPFVKSKQYQPWRDAVLHFRDTANRTYKPVGKEEEFAIIQAYLNGMTWRQLAIKFNRGNGTLWRILSRNATARYRGSESTQFKKGAKSKGHSASR